ncbi:hypothetical protein [Glycomyces xiaoerkulensis]|uniref:hypothetical protein n=1 Tax=Glycomyces xiaoerkulensis TaxID=2038139 RepID=UPI0012FFDAAF|nr:hypothetical protein [Glycomyces xiaoerkulensis]
MEQLKRALEDYLYDLDSDLDLPLEAAHALARGLDSQALRELAGQASDATCEVRELVPSVIEELEVDLSDLPEAVFTRAREAASAYLSGALRFTSAATRMAELLSADHYLSFDDRPDTTHPACEHLWDLKEWLDMLRDGYSDIAGCLFNSPEVAEQYFTKLAQALTDGDANG